MSSLHVGSAPQALNALLLSDGKPGHFRLSEGIVAAIARRRLLGVTRLEVRRPWWLPGRVGSALTNRSGMAGLVPSLFALDVPAADTFDLIISAGGDTLAANVALHRRYGCPNIFYGSLRRFYPSDFSLVLTSYAANAGRLNHVMALKPSAFDPDTLPQRAMLVGDLPIGLLIGGDSGTVRYTASDWQRLLALLQHDVGKQSWIVSNSRRTPPAISDRLSQLASKQPERIQFIDVRLADARPLIELLAACDVIAVTVDSSSMISEAVWARRKVVSLMPVQATLPDLEQGYRDYLEGQRWVAPLPLARANLQGIFGLAAGLAPIDGNPLDDLASLLQQKMPALLA